tara:strand:+ start:1946 stop:2254 length:309 start_codon:yes stop_codon:yes gene_type:complete
MTTGAIEFKIIPKIANRLPFLVLLLFIKISEIIPIVAPIRGIMKIIKNFDCSNNRNDRIKESNKKYSPDNKPKIIDIIASTNPNELSFSIVGNCVIFFINFC